MALTTSEEHWEEGLKLGACTCIKRGDGELEEDCSWEDRSSSVKLQFVPRSSESHVLPSPVSKAYF